MADVTMCKGGNCPRKQDCYRYMATPSQFSQSWFAVVPIHHNGDCDYYSKLHPGKKAA